MSHNLKVQAVAVVILVCCLSATALVMRPIETQRQGLRQSVAVEGSGALPPRVAISMAALGPFRSLAVDYLWYRATTLQQEGQFFEAYQLSQWITSLQPRAPHVWGFHAWNMAYNISVATHTPRERWDWVNKGITLLRDHGIPLNPRAVRLYKELGWIYFHKISHYSDDMHLHYKRMLALEWQEILGGTHVGTTTEEVVDSFRQIAEAPDHLDDLLVEHPEVAGLLAELDKLGYTPGEALLRQAGRVYMYTRSDDARLVAKSTGAEIDYDAAVYRLLKDPRYRRQMADLLPYLRKRVLKDAYHMDPAFMLELMREYGPLDWRHPASHGAYWSQLGVHLSGGVDAENELDQLNTIRQAIHSLQQLAWHGRIGFDPVSMRIDLLPDPRFIPAYDHAMETLRSVYESGDYPAGALESFHKGHENFLLRAVTDHYLYGDQRQAEAYYKRVRGLYADKPWNARSDRYRKTVAELVVDELRTHMDLLSDARQFIASMLGRAFDHGLANGRMDVFHRYVLIAREGYDQYQADKTARGYTGEARMGLLPFHRVLVETFIAYIQSPGASAESEARRQWLLTRSRVWANAPVQITQAAYDRVQPALAEQARQLRIDADAAFPEPPGMEAVRSAASSPEPAGDRLPAVIEQR